MINYNYIRFILNNFFKTDFKHFQIDVDFEVDIVYYSLQLKEFFPEKFQKDYKFRNHSV